MIKIIERLFPLRVITDDYGDPYLGRIYLVHVLRSVLPGVFLHYFFRGDHDRELHNHPWHWAVSLVLTGGYVEYRMEGKDGAVTRRVIRPLSLNLIRKDTFHRVELLEPGKGAWTLFIAGKRAAEPWGFIDMATRTFETEPAREARLKQERKQVA